MIIMEESEKTGDVEQEESTEAAPVTQPKKTHPLKTRRGGQIASVVIGLIVLLIVFLVDGPAEPIVYGFPPLKMIGLLSVVLSLFVTLIYKFMTDQVLMRELKKDLKKHQQQMKDARGDAAKVSEISKQSMQVNMKYMSQSMKPMLITIIPFLLIFNWLRGQYDGLIFMTLPFWPHTVGWIITYIVLSMIFTTAFRKILDVV